MLAAVQENGQLDLLDGLGPKVGTSAPRRSERAPFSQVAEEATSSGTTIRKMREAHCPTFQD